MASISANGSRGHHKFTLTVSEKSYSVTNNTSTVSYSFKISPVETGWNWDYSSKYVTCSCTINGKTYTKKLYSYNGSSTVTLASGSQTVTHNSDGSKSISFSFKVTDGIGVSYTPGSASKSGTLKLTTIPRKSTVSLSKTSVGIGSSFTAYSNRKSTAFTHTITLSMSGATSVSKTKVGASTSITVPTSWASAISSATSKTATVTCTTYNGSTNLGSTSKSITITVPSSSTYLPKVSNLTYSPSSSTKAIYDKFGGYIIGKTNVDISATYAAGSGASLKNTALSYGSSSKSGTTGTSLSATNVVLTSATTSLSAYCVDSRSRQSSTSTSSISAYSYQNPTINVFRAYRANSSGIEDAEGSNACLEYDFTIDAINNKNNKSYKIEYRKRGETTWQQLTGIPTISSYSQSGTINIAQLSNPITFDSESGYDFQLTVTDYFISVSMASGIDTTYVLLDFHESGEGLAIGKVSQRKGFEIASDIIISGEKDIYIYTADAPDPVNLFDIIKISDDVIESFTKLGWVDPTALMYEAPQKAAVIGYTNVYNTPNLSNGEVVNTIPDNNEVSIIGETEVNNNKWYIVGEQDTNNIATYGYINNNNIVV